MEQVQTDIETLNSYRLGPISVASLGATLILAILFTELMACSLLFQLISDGSRPPPAISGNFIMWSVGAIGFQMALIPTILVSFHEKFRIRLAFSVLLAVLFWVAHWIAWYVSGISPSKAALRLAGYPLGCAIAILPIGIPTWFFRLRLTHLADNSMGKPLTIGKMMGLTAAVAIVTAYAMQFSRMNDSRFMINGPISLFAAGVGIAGFILLLALFGLRKQRNLAVYFLATYGILFLVAGGGVWVATFFVGRAMLMPAAFYLSIAVVSLIVHSVLFTVALKMLRFNYRKVESQFRS